MSNNTWRVIGKVIKYISITFVFSVCGLVLWRVFSSGDPASMKKISVSEATYNAYAENGNSLGVYYQNLDYMSREENALGYFGATKVDIIPDAEQIQVVLRYNNSTLRYVAEDLELSSIPSREQDVFDIVLTVTTDLTPENKDDNGGNPEENPSQIAEKQYFHSDFMLSDQKNVYNYRKYIFEGVTIEEDTIAVFVDVYYKGEKLTLDTENDTRICTLCIYWYGSELLTRELTNDDHQAFVAWKEQNAGY